MLCTYISCSECQNQLAICVHNMFSPRSELAIFMYWTCNSMNNLSSYCGLHSWCKKRSFWQRFTCTGIFNGQQNESVAFVPCAVTSNSASCSSYGSVEQYRSFPRLQLFELIIHKDLKYLDFSHNKEWPDSEQMQDVSRTLWKIIGDKCERLERFIVPKELTYSSTMNKIFINGGQNLTHLTLKRNVPNNLFLSVIGQNCPNIKELDVAGADIVSGELVMNIISITGTSWQCIHCFFTILFTVFPYIVSAIE